MTSPNYLTHWEVSGYSPADKLVIDYFPTEVLARMYKSQLEAGGYKHVKLIPPRNPER
jgi:hypothetical protein